MAKEDKDNQLNHTRNQLMQAVMFANKKQVTGNRRFSIVLKRR